MGVSSGSFTTTSYEGRSLTFNWSVKSQSITNNTTTINWNLVGSGSYTAGWVTCGNFKVKIDGNQIYFSANRINVYSGTVVASGTYTLTHNTSGKKTFQAYAEAGIYNVEVNCTGSATWELPDIARNAIITQAPNFTDIENPKISYTNPAGTNVTSVMARISLTGASADIAYRDISKTGTSYTFNLTEAERNVLRQATAGKTRNVVFIIRTVINGQSIFSTVTKTLTITNADPIINSVTYKDNNSSTVSITGNNQNIIQNQSLLQLIISGVSAQKYATISKVTYTINSNTVDVTNNYSNPINIGTINFSTDFDLIVTATDSRGYTTSKSVKIQMLEWKLPFATINLARQLNYYAQTDITVNAQFSSVDNKNSVTVQYQYKKSTDVNYSSLIIIPNNTTTTASFDNAFDYDFKFVISDLFGSTTYNYILSKGIPLIFFDRNLNSVGINCFPRKANDICVNDKSLLPVLLFTGNDKGTITLSDSAANYSYLEIFYVDNNSTGFNSIRISNPNGRTVDLSIIEAADNMPTRTYIRRTAYAISGKTMTPNVASAGYVQIDGSNISTTSGTNYLAIYRVLGYE